MKSTQPRKSPIRWLCRRYQLSGVVVPVVVALEVVAEQLRGGVERVLLAVVRDQAVRGGCGNL